MEKKGMALRKKLAGGREGKRGVGAIENWCKEGNKETEEVLQEEAEEEREDWAFMNGRKVQRSPVMGEKR